MKVPTLTQSQRATVLGDPQPADVVGATPWYGVAADKPGSPCDVFDFNGNYMFTATVGIAEMVMTAVNGRMKLYGDNVAYVDVLRALQAQLRPIKTHEAVKRALDLIETTLHPDRDGQS